MFAKPQPKSLGSGLSDASVTRVVAGSDHFLLLLDSGMCFTWGNGAHGALGHGDVVSRSQPTLVEALQQFHVNWMAAGKVKTAGDSSSMLLMQCYSRTTRPSSRIEVNLVCPVLLSAEM